MSDSKPDEFTARRLQRQAEDEGDRPHYSGQFKCISCNHKWIGVAPVGTRFVDCPKCEQCFGHPDGPCFHNEDYHWECYCGGGIFRIGMNTGVYCVMCGKTQGTFEL